MPREGEGYAVIPHPRTGIWLQRPFASALDLRLLIAIIRYSYRQSTSLTAIALLSLISEHHHNEPQTGSLSTGASSRGGALGLVSTRASLPGARYRHRCGNPVRGRNCFLGDSPALSGNTNGSQNTQQLGRIAVLTDYPSP